MSNRHLSARSASERPFPDLPRPAAEARRAVQRGFSVVPLMPRSKTPSVPRGINDAIATRMGVRAHAKKRSHDNYGLVLDGEVFVLDVDGPTGKRSFRRLLDQHGALPPTVETITSRGRHYFFRARVGQPIRSSCGRLGPGIDVKGQRGYVVAAGSVHHTGRRYRSASGRALGEIEVALAPDWLLALVTKPPIADKVPPPAELSERRPDVTRAGAYANVALDSELDTLRRAPKGKRNSKLNKAAYVLGTLCQPGALDEAKVRARLTATALTVGLSPEETAKTITSGLRAGRQNRRNLDHLGARGAEPGPVEPVADDPLATELAALGETDADNAERFARRNRSAVAYVPGRGVLAFDGQIWRPGGDTLALRLAEDTARAIAGEARQLNDPGLQKRRQDWSRLSLAKPALDRMVALAKGRLEMPAEAFDAQPWLLCVTNGTLDLRTGRLRPHDPTDRLTRTAGVAFDPDARCPKFLRFISESLGRDHDTVAFVRKALGLSLTGEVSEQVLFYLKGCGRSGKSTLANLMRDLLSGYACHTGVETFTVKRHEPIPADLARLAGMRLVTAGEINHTQQFDEARIKGMTGGDPIPARHLYGQPFEYRPQFKLWLYANEFPKVRATDEAFWRRILVIPFDVAVPKGRVDMKLPAKLRAEASGILNWALAGCIAWQQEGLAPPMAVQAATAAWRHGADHVRRYLRERTVTAAGERTPAGVLHADFKTWCEEAGEKAVSMAKLKGRLIGLGHRTKKDNKGHFWLNLCLRA